jgi:putative acetyltransferase
MTVGTTSTSWGVLPYRVGLRFLKIGRFDNPTANEVLFQLKFLNINLSKIEIQQVSSDADLRLIRKLFLEYARSLEISLCFQNFEQELATLPGKYSPPAGRLYLAFEGQEAAGCVALRRLDQGICEMKRLYVRTPWRKKGLGRALAIEVIRAAEEIGYERMRLDTLASMQPAIALYHSLGFQEIAAYYQNPSESAVFMERLVVDPKEIGRLAPGKSA